MVEEGSTDYSSYQPREPVIIGTRKGDEENIVFCNFMQNNLPKIEWDRETAPELLWAIAKMYIATTPEQFSDIKEFDQDLATQAWNAIPDDLREHIKANVLKNKK